MKFIIGIGNPGKKYESTRHNIGFRVVEALAGPPKKEIAWKLNKNLEALVFKLDDRVSLVKPQTFVNLSGRTALGVIQKCPLKDILVVTDDVNLTLGKLRLRASGSAGGHHGLESVIEATGSEDFPRLRIGVGTANMPKDLPAFVLERFSGNEKKALSKILQNAALVCQMWVDQGLEAAVNRLSQLQSMKENGG